MKGVEQRGRGGKSGRIRGGHTNSSREVNHPAIKPIYLVFLTPSAERTTTALEPTRCRSQKEADFSFRHGFLPVDSATYIHIYTIYIYMYIYVYMYMYTYTRRYYTAGIVRRSTKNAHVF